MRIPVKPLLTASVGEHQLRRARALARLTLREFPRLKSGQDTFRHLLVAEEIGDAPTLHLDDFSEIPLIGTTDESAVLQQRARLRAFEGDYVVATNPPESGFEEYCQNRLGLGGVTWLSPQPSASWTACTASDKGAAVNQQRSAMEHPQVHQISRIKLAVDCWKDRHVRNELIGAMRREGLRYLHPYLSTLHVWELASLLRNASRRPFSVIGPPPALARWANNKIEFSRTVARLLGENHVPHTEVACNFAMLCKHVSRLAATNERLGIKYPHGSGGYGNFLIDCRQIRGRSLSGIRDELRQLLSGYRWPQEGRILLDVWEQGVICSPSVQTWIPPSNCGNPLIEGLFSQIVTGEQCKFAGCCTLTLPAEIGQRIVDSSYLLALLFQMLGYVGRCSFDLILSGEGIENCRVEFVECNARWGGTSLPMTLVNRLVIDQADRSWCVRKVQVPDLNRFRFSQIADSLGSELFDRNSGQGQFVLFNPARIKRDSAIDAIAIAESAPAGRQLLEHVLPDRLRQIGEGAVGDKPDEKQYSNGEMSRHTPPSTPSNGMT